MLINNNTIKNYIGKNILNIIIIGLVLYFILYFILYTYNSFDNVTELFEDASQLSPVITNNLNNLKTLINNTIYAIITNSPITYDGIYYDLNPKLEKLNVIKYKLYCMGPENDNDIKHLTNIDDISKNEVGAFLNLVKSQKDIAYSFGIENSRYYLKRTLLDSVRCGKRNSCDLWRNSRDVDITDIIKKIANEINEIINSKLNNELRNLFKLNIEKEDRNLIFTLKESDLTLENYVKTFPNTLFTFVNNYKNLSNILLDTNKVGIFIKTKDDMFKSYLRIVDSSKIVYGFVLTEYIYSYRYNRDFTVESKDKRLTPSQLITDNQNIIADIRIKRDIIDNKYYAYVMSMSYSFIKENNNFYFRRYLPYIKGKKKTKYDKKCNITELLNTFINNFKNVLPIKYTSIIPDIVNTYELSVTINL